MDEDEIDRIAARVVEKLMEPSNRQVLASAIAKELRLLGIQHGSEMGKLGERLDSRFY